MRFTHGCSHSPGRDVRQREMWKCSWGAQAQAPKAAQQRSQGAATFPQHRILKARRLLPAAICWAEVSFLPLSKIAPQRIVHKSEYAHAAIRRQVEQLGFPIR